jgi:hypothetical protein
MNTGTTVAPEGDGRRKLGEKDDIVEGSRRGGRNEEARGRRAGNQPGSRIEAGSKRRPPPERHRTYNLPSERT